MQNNTYYDSQSAWLKIQYICLFIILISDDKFKIIENCELQGKFY